jgi:glycosyltransferase involved in cell wall biosynthesis
MAHPFRIVCASPYREASVLALARAAADRHLLCCFVTTVRWRSFPGVPAPHLRTVGTAPEIVHVAVRRFRPTRRFAPRAMHWAKACFDAAVAERIATCGAGAVVGMLQSSLATFRAARSAGMLTALNFVNCHPAFHNAALRELGSLARDHHELIPPHAVDRADRELEVADIVIVPSRFVARQLLERGVPPSRLAVQPYGVDLEVFHPAESRQVTDGPLRCLFVGNVSHTKGIPFLLDAVRQLPRSAIDLILVGAVPTPALLRDLPANVTWMPPKSHDRIAAMMRSAAVLLVPSLDDAFPLVALEGLASGLAVVVSDNCGTAELISNGVDGLRVPPGDAGALAAVLRRLVEDRELVCRLGRAGRERVRDLTWARFARAVLARLVDCSTVPAPELAHKPVPVA